MSGQGVDTGAGVIAYEVLETAAPWSHEPTRLPVVFQHGIGLAREVWRPWTGAMPGQRRFVSIDLRGHGGSAVAWTRRDYPLSRYSDDVRCVLDHLGIERCHFVGESFGGTLGIDLATASPDRVASLTVLSTAYRGQWITSVAHWPQLVEQEGIEAWSREILDGRFVPGAVSPELVAWVAARQCAVAPEVIAGVVRCLLGVDLADALGNMTCPLLILAPSGSPFVAPSRQIALNHAVEGSEIAFIRGRARHGIVMSHWREASQVAAGFIDRVEADYAGDSNGGEIE